ncbi:MAG: DUF2189 domain-containing protein [Pseudomonadota bacterium]
MPVESKGQQNHQAKNQIAGLTVRIADFEDLKVALNAGFRDFTRRPVLSGFFGFVYALGGIMIFAALTIWGETWMIIPVAVGFPLVAPFIAAGLYDISRRLERGETFEASDVFTVVWNQQRRELGWMAFVVLFIFWLWMYQIRLLLALFLGRQSFTSLSSLDGFLNIITTTQDGILFIVVGTFVGAILASVLFTTVVMAMPVLLDRDIDFISAMILSFKSVAQSPFVMLSWGAFISAITILAMIPVFVGLVFVLPVFGHASWHLYRRLISPVAT